MDPPIEFHDFSQLPEGAKRIVDGVGAAPAFCGHCRQPGALMRCTRCKAVKYCSADCQKNHFRVHKKNCKAISKKRESLEINCAGVCETRSWEQGLQTLIKMQLADLLVKVGYCESDTVAHGSSYYREALKYYLEPLHLDKVDDFHTRFRFIEDRVLLLLVVLGGDDGTLGEWCMETHSERGMCFYWSEDAEDDFTFEAISLLALMKLMANYRRDLEGLEVYKETMQAAAINLGYAVSMDDMSKHVYPYLMGDSEDGKIELEVMPARIRSVISTIRRHGNEGCLIHLRDSIPYTRDHAPMLFPNPSSDAISPPELWMIFQDCFFETPGLNDVLHEFFPEDD